MSMTFQEIFRSDCSKRDKFLSRVFGIFSEEIIRCWCDSGRAPYCNLGRPTIKLPDEKRGCTLDFTFKSRDGRVFVGEMKCELEYEQYSHLTLECPKQVEYHKGGKAFGRFLEIAKDPSRFEVTADGTPVAISGSILVWGRCTQAGRTAIMSQYGLHDVLSLEAIISDLLTWQNERFNTLLNQHEIWTGWLFEGLRKMKEACR